MQHLHRRRAVLVLRALVLARHDDAGRQVRDADRRVGDVDVLAAGAARPVGVDAQVLVVDLDLDVVGHLGPDEDRGERRVPARGLSRTARCAPAGARRPRPSAGRRRTRRSPSTRRALDAGLVAGLVVDDLRVLKPRRSAQRRYMRSSISAQSCDSVPPAPGWMVTMALRASCSPPSIFLISPASTSLCNSSSPRARSASTASPCCSPFDAARSRSSARRRSDVDERDVLLEPPAALQDLLRLGLVLPEVGRADRALRCASVLRPDERRQR